MSFSNIRFSSDPSSITSLSIMLMLTLMLMAFIHYYFYSKASSSNSAAPKEEKYSSEPKTMVSTSVSSIQKSFKYDVFLSFRGEDTRNRFVGHLYQALQRHGIETYKDDKKIEQGKPIKDQLMKSIEDSRFYIIVFSKTYASSSWCLDELVKIMKCKKTTEQNVYPIFFDVEPTEVRKQSGAVKEAFAEHEKKEAAGKWREAMKEASDLAGWELKGDESELIQIIVDVIFKKKYSTLSNADGKLVGMETRISEVLSSLEIGTEDVRMIGIKGMGGGGKTTLARAVYDQISKHFEGKSFVENVREVSKPTFSGLKELQKRILEDVLNKQDITVSSVHDGTNMLKDVMRRIKTLVVLDDVDCIDQLEALAGEPNWFKKGSRIIITTRDEQVLLAHRMNFIHDVNLLSSTEAICLFSRYAFQAEIPTRGYEELSGQVVQYAHGLPLTIKVLGSFLCGQSKPYWVDAIERLKKIPLKKTMERLEISFDGLEEDYKEIFLDVACILKGRDKEDAIRALESRGFRAQVGLRVLEQKSLITIDKRLGMHDHLQEMGRNIVRRSHPDEPQRHSRLWVKEEIEDILTNDLGTQATKCLRFISPGFSAEIAIKGLAKMKDLRFIHISRLHRVPHIEDIVQFDRVSEYLPSSLRFMRWYGFPFSSLPNTFQGKNLVGLDIHSSNIVQLWEDGEEKVLHKLRFFTIRRLKLRTFDLRLAPNLEQLTIDECSDFEELHIPADHHSKLEHLHLTASKLTNLHLGNTPNLVQLEVDRSNIVQLWEDGEEKVLHKLRFLTIMSSKLRTFDLRLAPNLEQLTIFNCGDFVELHMPVESVKLEYLDLSHLKLKSLRLRNTPSLKKLILEGGNDLVELQMPAESPKLEEVSISRSKLRTLDLGLTPNLEKLHLADCYDLVELQMPAESPKLEEVNISRSKLRTLDLGLTLNLEKLHLADCYDLVELQMPAESPKLEEVNISRSKLRTLDLGLTLNLEKLHLADCYDLVELQMPAESPKLEEVNIRHSKLRTFDLRLAPNLEQLTIDECSDFEELHIPADHHSKLEHLHLTASKLTNLHLGNTPNLVQLEVDRSNIVQLWEDGEEKVLHKLRFLTIRRSKLQTFDLRLAPNLEQLTIANCGDFVELHIPADHHSKLEYLHLTASLTNLHLGNTPNLVGLDISGDNIVQLWEDGEEKVLHKLRFLTIRRSKLQTFDLRLAPNLERLTISSCEDFIELHMPVESVKLEYLDLTNLKLKSLRLRNTPSLKKLILIACNDLVELQMPAESLKLEHLHLSHSKLTNLHLGNTPNLKTLILECCNHLVELQMPAESLKLEHLNLRHSGLTNLHLGSTPNLEILVLSHSKLKTLYLGSTPNLKRLTLEVIDDLVELQMPGESTKLEEVDIYCSKLKTLHLGSTPNLERLSLKGCNHLVDFQMPPESLGLKHLDLSHSKLKNLHLRNTPNLEKLILEGLKTLRLGSTPNLERLSLKGCNHLVDFQMPPESLGLKHLDLSHSKLKNLHLSHSKLKNLHLRNTPNLEKLILEGCYDLVELQMPVENLKLEHLKLTDSKLTNLHLRNTPNLKMLILKCCNDLVELQIPVENLKLEHLELSYSKLTNLHLRKTPNLKMLILEGCNDLVELQMPAESPTLELVDLLHSKLKTLHLGSTPNLKVLTLGGCKDLVELQMPVESTLEVEELNLGLTKLRTLDLGLTPNLKRLNLERSYDLVEINAPVGYLKKLEFLNLSCCGRFKSFWFYKWFQPAEAGSLSELHLIAEPTDVCLLHPNNSFPKFQFECYYKEDPNSSCENLEMLISMGLCACTNLENFSRSICSLRGLRKLTLEGSIPEVPRDLDQLECLEELIFSSTNIRNLPDSICKLKHLKSLELKSCLLLKKLPDDLGRIESLETLTITNCNCLRDIPNNMGKIKCVISPKVYNAVDRPKGANT